MNRRFRLSRPALDAWVEVLLMAGVFAMTAIIVTSPDVMSLIA